MSSGPRVYLSACAPESWVSVHLPQVFTSVSDTSGQRTPLGRTDRVTLWGTPLLARANRASLSENQRELAEDSVERLWVSPTSGCVSRTHLLLKGLTETFSECQEKACTPCFQNLILGTPLKLILGRYFSFKHLVCFMKRVGLFLKKVSVLITIERSPQKKIDKSLTRWY